MQRDIALVTGASGFVGRWAIRALRNRGWRVRAGVHRPTDRALYGGDELIDAVTLDVLDRQSMLRALRGVSQVFHFAALLDPKAPSDDLFRINAEGTRSVWECAAACNVAAALYCSSAAVYGLLASSVQPVSEGVMPRAVEAYGRSKLMGESAALEISKKSGLPTVIIRPVAVFGPGQTTLFGNALRNAAVSRILLAEGFQGKKFCFVHVEDVAEAAVYLLGSAGHGAQTYNVASGNAISFDDAFRAYRNALKCSGRLLLRARLLALISLAVRNIPAVWGPLGFRLWRPGFDITYSSEKLMHAGFQCKWNSFKDVILSCITDERLAGDRKGACSREKENLFHSADLPR